MTPGTPERSPARSTPRGFAEMTLFADNVLLKDTAPSSINNSTIVQFGRCADVTSHAIVLWLQTLGPIEREGATVLVKP